MSYRDHHFLNPDDAMLTGGRWVRRGLIQVWVTDQPRPRDVPPCISHNTERGWQWHREHRIDWPLTRDAECGCWHAHHAHVVFVKWVNKQRAAEQLVPERGAA